MEYSERLLRVALTRSGDRITRAVARLGDANGQRDGADLYDVIDQETERAGRNVARQVDAQSACGDTA